MSRFFNKPTGEPPAPAPKSRWRCPGAEDRDKVILDLWRTGDLSQREIARRLGLSTSTVNFAINRGRRPENMPQKVRMDYRR